jgi:hypothetical protein
MQDRALLAMLARQQQQPKPKRRGCGCCAYLPFSIIAGLMILTHVAGRAPAWQTAVLVLVAIVLAIVALLDVWPRHREED